MRRSHFVQWVIIPSVLLSWVAVPSRATAEEPFQVEVNVLSATIKSGGQSIAVVKRETKLMAHDASGNYYLVDVPGATPPQQGWINKADIHRVVDDFAELKRRIAALPDADRARAEAESQAKLKERDELTAKFAWLDEHGKAKEALALAQQIVANTRDSLGEKNTLYAGSLNNLGVAALRVGDHATAKKSFEQFLAIQRELTGDVSLGVAMANTNLAIVAGDTADYPAARRYSEQALSVYRKTLGEKSIQVARTLNNMGVTLREAGDYPAAKSCLEQSLAIKCELLGEKNHNTADAIDNLGSLDRVMGDFIESRKLHEKALAIYREVVGDEHFDTARCLIALGTVSAEIGDFAAARTYGEEALATFRKVFGEKNIDTAVSLGLLGNIANETGDFSAAKQYFTDALSIERNVFGEWHPYTASSLANLGLVAKERGEFSEARKDLEEALAIQRKVLGEKHGDISNTLNSLGLVAESEGDYSSAKKYLEQSFAIDLAVFGDKHPDVACAFNNLGSVAEDMADFPSAEKYYEQALAIKREVLGRQHPEYARTLRNLGETKLAIGKSDEALGLALEAAQCKRQHLDRSATVQSEREQLAMAQDNHSYLDLVISASRSASRGSIDAVYDQVLAWKGAVTERQEFLRAMRTDAKSDSAILQLYTDLQDATRQFEASANFVPPKSLRESHSKQLETLSQRIETLQQTLAEKSSRFAEQFRQRRLTSAELRAVLPTGVALVDVVQYASRKFPPPKQKHPIYEGRLMAFVVRRDKPIMAIDLGAAEPLAEAVDLWRAQQIGAPAAGSTAAKNLDETRAAWKSTEADADPGKKLREWVWDKLPADVRDADKTPTVLISPDGPLARFPWPALPGSKNGTYLLEEQAVAVIPEASGLPQLLAVEQDRPRTKVNQSLLLVGSVNYGGDPGVLLAANRGEQAVGNGAQIWPNLPGTRTEVLSIQDSFLQHFDDGNAKLLRKDAATKQAVCELAPRFRFLHLATHGFFADPDFQPITVADDRAESAGSHQQARVAASGNHPGLLSGIVLTGANQPASEGKDDGILTALEVGELDLSGVNLVTLSACETGLGATAGGEGVLGLQRAFQIAGARTTIATLWKVSDDASRGLMIDMYQNLWGDTKMSKIEALRQAQLKMLREGTSRGLELGDHPVDKRKNLPPFYWAAFILSGDWR